MKNYVNQIMSKNIISVNKNDTIIKANELLRQHNIHHLVVMFNNRLEGVVSSNDILLKANNSKINVEEIMEKEVVSIKENASIKSAAKYFIDNNLHCLPVLDESNKLVGIVTTTDLIKLLA